MGSLFLPAVLLPILRFTGRFLHRNVTQTTPVLIHMFVNTHIATCRYLLSALARHDNIGTLTDLLYHSLSVTSALVVNQPVSTRARVPL